MQQPTSPAGSEAQLAALREEFQRAGAGTRSVRRWFGGGLTGPLLFGLLVLAGFGMVGAERGNVADLHVALGVVCLLVVGIILGGAGLASLAAETYRHDYATFLQQQLLSLSAQDQTDLLACLEDDPSADVRHLAAQLRPDPRPGRGSHLTTELLPAAPPGPTRCVCAPHGDEATPAG